MKKRSESKELDFNFDEPVVERKPASAAKSVGFESEIRQADSYGWGRDRSSVRPNILTPEEVMGARGASSKQTKSAASKPVRPTEPVPMRPSEPKPAPTEPSVDAGSMSFAARMILQRMQETETAVSSAEESEAVRQTVAHPRVPEFLSDEAEKPVLPTETIPMSPAKSVPGKAEEKMPAVEDAPVKPATELSEAEDEPAPAPVGQPEIPADGATRVIGGIGTPPAPAQAAGEEDSFAASRQKFVDSFELDLDVDAWNDEPLDGATRVLPSVEKPDPDFGFLPPRESEKKAAVETIEDYRSVDDADVIYTEFLQRRRRLTWRSVATVTLAVLLLLLTFSENLVPFGQPAFFIAVGVLLVLGAIFNLSLFTSVASLFRGRNDSDFGPMLALVASMLQTAAAGWAGGKGMTASSLLACVAMVSVACNDLGKLAIVKRILLNFETVGNEETKQAVAFVGSPVSSRLADPGRVGESLILGRCSAIDLKGYLSASLSPDPYEETTFRTMIASLAVGVVSAGLTFFLQKGSLVDCLTAFSVVAAICAPFSSLISVGRHFLRTCRQLLAEGTMLTGYRAAENISEANVVGLNADELFADECVSLYNFKTFQDFPIDTAILIAAALTKEGNSPLAGMFNQIVASNSGRTPSVDTVIYEDRMGLTGWVNDRKTLLGNRMILESHNIPAPPLSLDKKIVASGKFPVYLAVDDRLVAIFIVGYQADRSLLQRVRRLINTGVTLLVDTADPNVTEQLIADRYGIPKDAVLVMSAETARRYREQFAPREQETACMTADNVRGYLDGYLAAYRLRQSATFACVLTVVMMCAGLALAIALPLLGMGQFVNAHSVLILHATNYATLYLVNVLHRT